MKGDLDKLIELAGVDHTPRVLRVVIDGRKPIRVELHPGWDDDGEELGDPEYLDIRPDPEAALEKLGIPVEFA